MRKLALLGFSLVLLGFASTSQAAPVVEVDPNETFATAQVVGPGSFTTDFDANIFSSTTIPHATVLGSASAGGFDFYRFTTFSAGTIGLDIDSAPVGTNFDTTIHLYDAAGNPIASNDDNGGDPGDGGGLVGGAFNSRILTGVLPAGTYTVGVAEFPSGAGPGGAINNPIPGGGTYTLHISAFAAPEPATILLFGLGAVAAGGYEWRRRRKAA